MDKANKTFPVVASAAQMEVSWEYLLRPRISFVSGGHASGLRESKNGLSSSLLASTLLSL